MWIIEIWVEAPACFPSSVQWQTVIAYQYRHKCSMQICGIGEGRWWITKTHIWRQSGLWLWFLTQKVPQKVGKSIAIEAENELGWDTVCLACVRLWGPVLCPGSGERSEMFDLPWPVTKNKALLPVEKRRVSKTTVHNIIFLRRTSINIPKPQACFITLDSRPLRGRPVAESKLWALHGDEKLGFLIVDS